MSGPHRADAGSRPAAFLLTPPLAATTLQGMLAEGGLARALFAQSPFSTVIYAPDGRPVQVSTFRLGLPRAR